METQLEDIIQKIHNEGVKSAEERARHIVEQAEKRAHDRIEDAKSQAKTIVEEARQEAAKEKSAGEAALKQASRDLLLALRSEITALFESVQREAVSDTLSSDKMAEIIHTMVTKWSDGHEDTFEVLVNERDRDALESSLRTKLAEKMRSNVEIRPVRSIGSGFRIGSKDGAAYYDFTDETIADVIAAYLNPRLAEIMKSATEQ